MAGAGTAGAPGRGRALVAFAAFGVFWGTWGGALPAIRAHAGVSEGELGVALLCIGAGALASMRLAGAVTDRLGAPVLPVTAVLLGLAGVLPALATSPVALGAVLLVLGVASGAMDVAANAEGVRAEAASGRPLMSLAHAAFSAGVMVASLAAGALRQAGTDVAAIFALCGGARLLAALRLARLDPAPAGERPAPAGLRALLHVPRALAVLGALTATAFFIENAWQSWSAVHLESDLGAAPGAAALGPAFFAGAAAAGRLAGQGLVARVGEAALLAGGALVAAAGRFGGARAPSTALAVAGIAVAGAGSSVCAPVLTLLAGRGAAPGARASAVSIVTTIAYLGFLVGPAVVGLAAGAIGLRASLAAVAGLAVGLALAARVAAPVSRPAATPS